MDDAKRKEMPSNLAEIKKMAKQSLEQGALTQDYPLNLEQVYKLLNDALATEIMCVLRYRHHQVIAQGIDRPQVAAEFLEHADDEQRHMMMIAERINQLGGNPDFNPATISQRTATEYGTGRDLLKLVEEDLIAERIAIMVYREMIEWFGTGDPTTRRMLEEILKDEEDHADDLSDLLKIKNN
ncbi:ferritin-like domain-containing protein [Legionella maioricensis]|uniref:Ferritin-like domain-containing protein n=1 Tax=Legionella maioricensis TaxID=2896528 RepID=A0A9X2D1K6_9GAMM|nr:ferritin-like domain-containing protein [Legionella maioricensis]MCL9684736.1 ferritin-like domain-containing protein [Legionella maioricensis]MCL9687764.1 ferritin-like domain-containing protein [Legionella maioricensis]